MSDNERLSVPRELREALIAAGWRPPRTRSKRVRETSEMISAARRQMRALADRVTRGDVEDFAKLVTLADEIDRVIGIAVSGLCDEGVSYGEIGRAIGVSRQAVRQRWGTLSPT